jgi:hypothetical protein
MNSVRLAVAVSLLVLPALTRRWAVRSEKPAMWARFVLVSLVAGATLLAAGLAHEALPLVLSLAGPEDLAAVCLRIGGHVIARMPFGGWLSVGLLAILLTGSIRGVIRARSRWDNLHAEPMLGDHRELGQNEIVILDTPQHLAVSVPGSPGQVLVSQSVVSELDAEQFDGLIRHEEAHLDLHHARFLLAGAAVDGAFGSVGPIHRGVTSLRLSLERWADEVAIGSSQSRRAALRGALTDLAAKADRDDIGHDRELVAPRVTALINQPSPTPRIWPWAVGAVTIGVILASLTGTLGFHVVKLLIAGT